jgi:EAL domain-containing protein (putative c-di-GMP-specific phosphodiesterase class I)
MTAGCDAMQGYLFSKPLSAAQATRFLGEFSKDKLTF